MLSLKRAIALSALGILVTCYWSDASPSPNARIPIEPSATSIAPIRRLTRAEYNNTVRDLLGDTTRPANSFPADAQTGGLSNDANNQSTSALQEQHYLDAATLLAQKAATNLPSLLACANGEDARVCAQRFVTAFGRRAWRRPLTTTELTRLMSVYDASTRASDGVAKVITSLLVSPYFLYRPEPGIESGHVTSWELASRLSYFF